MSLTPISIEIDTDKKPDKTNTNNLIFMYVTICIYWYANTKEKIQSCEK